MRPKRIQMRRTKGWRLPANTVCVTRPSMFGNPYPMTATRSARQALRAYRMGLRARWSALQKLEKHSDLEMLRVILYFQRIRRNLHRLRGKNLCCWCKLCKKHAEGLPLGLAYRQAGVACPVCEPCHVDPLLEVANG